MSHARRILLTLALIACATSAPAQTISTNIIGTVGASSSPAQDTDTLGLFGAVGANLNGLKMKVTLKFDASVMQEGGQSPGYSAWSGLSGSCAVTIGGVHAKPSIDEAGGIDSSRVYLWAGAYGQWALVQFAQNSNAPDTCGISVVSTKHAFVPSAALVQAFSYQVPNKERADDYILLDITVGGIRETVNADVKSVTYGD